MASENSRNHANKIGEALEFLNDAAREKKEEMQDFLSEKHGEFQDFIHQAAIANKRAIRRFKQSAEGVWEDTEKQARRTAATVDKNVHKNPWAYIGGAAFGALVLGYVLGSSARRN